MASEGGKREMPKGTRLFAKLECDFILHDPRYLNLTPNAKLLYVTIWIAAVNCGRDLLPLDYDYAWMHRQTGCCYRTIIRNLELLTKVNFVKITEYGIKVYGVRSKHPRIEWKKGTQVPKKVGRPAEIPDESGIIDKSQSIIDKSQLLGGGHDTGMTQARHRHDIDMSIIINDKSQLLNTGRNPEEPPDQQDTKSQKSLGCTPEKSFSAPIEEEEEDKGNTLYSNTSKEQRKAAATDAPTKGAPAGSPEAEEQDSQTPAEPTDQPTEQPIERTIIDVAAALANPAKASNSTKTASSQRVKESIQQRRKRKLIEDLKKAENQENGNHQIL